jgi:hypothetical protein
MRVPIGVEVLVRRDGSITPTESEIETREAADILSCSVRQLQVMCQYGGLVEGRDWRRDGRHRGGCHGFKYKITLAAVLRSRLKNAAEWTPDPH